MEWLNRWDQASGWLCHSEESAWSLCIIRIHCFIGGGSFHVIIYIIYKINNKGTRGESDTPEYSLKRATVVF